MNVYDTANKLAYEIKNSEEYINYKNMKKAISDNPDLKEKLDRFEKERYEVQLKALSGGEQDIEKSNDMQRIYTELIENDIMKKYFDAELKFNVMLADVNKIISESVEDVIR